MRASQSMDERFTFKLLRGLLHTSLPLAPDLLITIRGGTTREQLDALAAFVRAIRPPESPLDKFLNGDAGALSREAIKGAEIFFGKGTCSTCHVPLLFTNSTLQINQRNATFSGTMDLGAAFVGTGPPLAFKVPQLRGVRLTPPYMHNGALGTLEQAVAFYNKSFSLGLTPQEMHHLVEFLKSL